MKYILILASLVLFYSCSPNNTPPEPAQSAYDGSMFSQNTRNELITRNNLTNLINEMKKPRTNSSYILDYDKLISMYGSGLNNVQDMTVSNHTFLIKKYLQKASDASGKTYNPASTLSGGVFNGYLFDQFGLEQHEYIEKSLITAAFYNHFLELTRSTITLADVDKMVCILGTDNNFNNGKKINGQSTDFYFFQYAARRTDINNPNGFYFLLKNDFIKLQEAVKKGDSYNEQKIQAIANIKSNFERAMAATIINYCYTATTKLSASSISGTDMASALHSLSEAAGFTTGLRYIEQSDKLITNAQIDEILSLFEIQYENDARYYKYYSDSFNKVNDLVTIQNKLKSIYSFTSEEMKAYERNFIQDQPSR